jgi:hypothetical protein
MPSAPGGPAGRSTPCGAGPDDLARSGFLSKVHFRRKPGFNLTPSQITVNAARSAVETVFAARNSTWVGSEKSARLHHV